VVRQAEHFGEALRNLRRSAGLTQEELAERAGISPRSISGLERGEGAVPRRDTLRLLERALGLAGGDLQRFQALVVRPQPAHRTHHNLPRALTSFVGRERALSDLARVLTTAPLVTLIGAGGVGKTRLAQELARLHVDSFADGAWFLELAEVADPSLVARSVAIALGLRDVGTRNPTDLLLDALQTKHILLDFDNCEQVVGACADLLRYLLTRCPRLHVLATSREPLAIDGEIVWLVPPLDVPDVRFCRSADQITTPAAVRLFVQRARAINPGFVVTDENAPAIAQICVAVDGIPLALELAAACTRVLTVGQVSERLEADPGSLHGTSRDAPPRHRSIRATIDWSHDLLGHQEQILLRRLALFAGSWTLDMAEAVCAGAGLEGSDVLDVLGQLVDKSLVLVDARNAVARYRLIEPIRQHALERLEVAGEAA
jgi:predicted ATPase/DNA-binding XRE family transcriptional regulator